MLNDKKSFSQVFFAFLLGILVNTIHPIDSKNILIEESEEFLAAELKRGAIYQKAGNFSKALNAYIESLETFNNSNVKGICVAEIYIGMMYLNLGEMEQSQEKFQEALRIAQQNNLGSLHIYLDKVLQIHSLYNEGREQRRQNLYQNAIDTLSKAITLAREIDSKEHLLKCLRGQGLTYYEWDNLGEFLRLSEEALLLAEDLKHKVDEAKCTNNIGYCHMKSSNLSKALEYFDRSLKLAEEHNLTFMMPITLNNMGIIYKDLGEFEKAFDYLNRGLELDKQDGDPYNIALVLNDIGTTLRHSGLISNNIELLDKALKYYEQCLDLAKSIKEEKERIRLEITVFNNMGTVFSDMEKYEKALNFFQKGYDKAADVNEIRNMGMLLNNIGIVHSNMGNYSESTTNFLRSIDLGTRLNSGLILWEAYLELARTYAKQGKNSDALEKFQDSINQIEKIRSQINLEEFKASFMGSDKRIEAYQEIISMLIVMHEENPLKGFDKSAFDYLERGKARAFLDSLEVSQLKISQNVDFLLQNKEAEIMKEISTLYSRRYVSSLSSEEGEEIDRNLLEKEAELESLKREIRRKNPAYANLRYPRIISIKEAQNLISSKTAFIEYSIGKQSSHAFIITKNDMRMFSIPSRETVKNCVKKYLESISDKENSNFGIGEELYNILLKPGLREGINNLIIVADDILHYLPFETLIIPHSKQWLIEEYRVAYTPSISSLNELIERKRNNGKKRAMEILALGDPDFGHNEIEDNGNGNSQDNINTRKYARLLYSGDEIQRISGLFNHNKITKLIRTQATEDIIKQHNLKNYKIIHFATHSEIDNEAPFRSHVLLSLDEDPTEDGILQAREIYNLELNSDLVTLSACETGLGKLIRGEGIEGLNRAFFYAGTSSVLMSLWPVNDQATFQLMERFYTHLKNSNSIVDSIRNAKLEMIESDILSHPFYWAGFIATGKTDHVIFSNTQNKLVTSFIIFVVLLLICFSIVIIRNKRNKITKRQTL